MCAHPFSILRQVRAVALERNELEALLFDMNSAPSKKHGELIDKCVPVMCVCACSCVFTLMLFVCIVCRHLLGKIYFLVPVCFAVDGTLMDYLSPFVISLFTSMFFLCCQKRACRTIGKSEPRRCAVPNVPTRRGSSWELSNLTTFTHADSDKIYRYMLGNSSLLVNRPRVVSSGRCLRVC